MESPEIYFENSSLLAAHLYSGDAILKPSEIWRYVVDRIGILGEYRF